MKCKVYVKTNDTNDGLLATDEGEHRRLEPRVVRLYERRLLDGVEPVVPGLGLRLQG